MFLEILPSWKRQILNEITFFFCSWLRTQHALMYDPAIVRVVDILITKLILLLVAEVSPDTSVVVSEDWKLLVWFFVSQNSSLKWTSAEKRILSVLF